MRYASCLALACVFGTMAAQPQIPGPTFEVASVKPAAANDAPGLSIGWRMRAVLPAGLIPTVDPGRVRIENWTLLDLIAAAWRVRTAEVSGPAWLSDVAFDIEARIPEGAARGQVNEMLQALLAERFGLKLHRESKIQPGYALLVGKSGPKLKVADPGEGVSQQGSQEERAARSKEAAMAMLEAVKKSGRKGAFSRSSYKAITIAELAHNLTRFVDGPVVDRTELAGKYDVTVETSGNTPDEPGVTIFDAVEKLGLKLESRKVTIDSLVIDQVSKTPTAN